MYSSDPFVLHRSLSVVLLSVHVQVLATASTDYKCRIVWAYFGPEFDGPPDTALFGPPDMTKFGQTIHDFDVPNRAWVNDVSWSPSGRQLAFISHDGLLHVNTFAPSAGAVLPVTKVGSYEVARDLLRVVVRDVCHLPCFFLLQLVKTAGLPAMRVLWLNEQSLVTAGHNLRPEAFAQDAGGNWSFLGSCEPKVSKISGCFPSHCIGPPHCCADVQEAGAGAAGTAASSSFDTAKSLFGAKVTRGGGSGSEASKNKHQSAITFLQPYASGGECTVCPPATLSMHSHPISLMVSNRLAGAGTSVISTSSCDGKVIIWDLKKSEAAATLRLS
jgi:hypothetical protein